jgi:signal peptidase II
MRTRKILLVLFILFSVVGCDRATKILATDKFSNSPPLSFLYDTFVLQYAENTGAFLSFGSEFSESVKLVLFVILPILLICGFFIYILVSDEQSKIQIIGCSLIIGGGLGILYDRVFLSGHVVDFINIGIGPIRTGIFNVADAAIMVGFFVLMYTLIFKYNKNKSLT